MNGLSGDVLLLVIGIVLAMVSVNWLGQGLSRVLQLVKAPGVLSGIVLTAIGTSAMELVFVVFAITNGEKNLALGTILGLYVANLGLVLGLSTIINPLPPEKDIFRREVPVMFTAFVLFYILCRDLELSRFDGLILILFFVLFIFLACKSSGFETLEDSIPAAGKLVGKMNWRAALVIVLMGLAGLIWGADLILQYGHEAGRRLGLSGWLTGLIFLSVLIATAKVAVSFLLYKKSSNISASGLVGANIFNILLVLGVMALVDPLYLSSELLRFDLPMIFIFSAILLLVLRTGVKITRSQGALALLGYLVFIVIAIIKNR